MIKGLTDKASIDRQILGRVEITVFKGARKTERSAGKTLQDKYRIASNNPRVIKALKCYGSPNNDGDVLTDHINVVFPFDEPERTFQTAMKAYSASGLEVVCDRATISQKAVQRKDEKGNIYRPIETCTEPCPIANQPMGVKCPNQCSPTGILYFYIRELFEVGMMIPAKMTLHAYSDITYVHSQLERMRYEMGSITNSLFPCYPTKHKVPFVLTRSKIEIKRPVVSGKEDGYKRTGKKATGEAWAVEISPSPEYLELFQAWKQVEEMKRHNILPSQSAIAGLLAGNANAIVDAEIVLDQGDGTKKALMPATVTQDEWEGVMRIFFENGWENSAVKRLLLEKYGYSRAGEVMASQIDELCAIAQDEDERKFWMVSSI